jgi:2-polyprenyl-3-methyl-5-hydroxy-6-metoxy-1,4-benzoquinol methylase
VLDIGCAAGALGAGLRARGAHVTGVEVDPEFAAAARERLDEVMEGDIEQALAGGRIEGPFDCVVAADVLEHLRDPWAVVRRAAALLAADGRVVVSVPNVRFFETFWQLGVLGRWPRRDAGIFDRDHLRWFTRRDAAELLEQAGLEVVETRALYRLRPLGSRFDGAFGALIARVPGVRDFFAFQFLIVGIRR